MLWSFMFQIFPRKPHTCLNLMTRNEVSAASFREKHFSVDAIAGLIFHSVPCGWLDIISKKPSQALHALLPLFHRINPQFLCATRRKKKQNGFLLRYHRKCCSGWFSFCSWWHSKETSNLCPVHRLREVNGCRISYFYLFMDFQQHTASYSVI